MADLLLWWNLVYVLAFFLALLYIVLNSIGLISEGAEVDVDADADIDMAGVDSEIDAAVDVDGDVGVDADVGDVDSEVDHDLPAEPSFFEEALSFFGIGRLPLSIVLMTFLLTFAIVGWAVNLLLKDALVHPGAFFPLSLSAAIFCGLAGTKLLAGTLGRYLRPIDSAATSKGALEGRIATAKLPITASFGRALVRDQHGSLHKIACRVAEGAETIPKGQTILLVRFVRGSGPARLAPGHYLVEPYEVPGSTLTTERRR